MAFQDHMHGVFRIDQIFVDKRKSVFILIFQKCNPHLFLEKTAEISILVISNTCNLIQRNRPFVILRNIIQHQMIYALSDFLIMIVSWLVKQSLRAFLFQEVQP